MPCKHLFCVDCFEQYLTITIESGNTSISCPGASENGPCTEPILQHQIRHHTSNDLFERYLRLQFERAVDHMSDVFYCPKADCATATINANPSSTNVVCGQCNYHFCTQCGEAEHFGGCDVDKSSDDESQRSKNPLSKIFKLPGLLKLGNEKIKHASSEEKSARERRRQRRKEEQKTIDELKRSDETKQCPGCKTWIHKTSGCDHMTCHDSCGVSPSLLFVFQFGAIKRFYLRGTFVGSVDILKNHTMSSTQNTIVLTLHGIKLKQLLNLSFPS